nr:MAG TPA_asm: hypothetical protein [Bacteriophage sp.]
MLSRMIQEESLLCILQSNMMNRFSILTSLQLQLIIRMLELLLRLKVLSTEQRDMLMLLPI